MSDDKNGYILANERKKKKNVRTKGHGTEPIETKDQLLQDFLCGRNILNFE